ncbi:MAG: hypothetical protein ACLSVU_00375 [Christensenellales bacterium]
MKTLIENAIVLTMDDEMRVFDRGYVLTDGANIAEVAGRFAATQTSGSMRAAAFCSPDL